MNVLKGLVGAAESMLSKASSSVAAPSAKPAPATASLAAPRDSFQLVPLPVPVPMPSLAPLLPPQVSGALAQAASQKMTNDQLITMSETPSGAAMLKQMAEAMKQVTPMTAATQKEIDRIGAATFSPGAGLKLPPAKDVSAPEAASRKQEYLRLVKRTMLESPSFTKLMNDINNDAKHPTTINLDRNGPTALDAFATSTLDLADLAKLPRTPAGEEITQGSVLAHAMREQHEKARGTPTRDPAHRKAIDSENEYRRDIGQKVERAPAPIDQTITPLPGGGHINTVFFKDGTSEALLFTGEGNLLLQIGPR